MNTERKKKMNYDIKNKLNYNLLQHIYYQDRIGNKEGFIKYYPNNTDKHEDIKWNICKKLKKEQYEVYTECRFKNNKGRADIIAIKNRIGYIIEIANNEKEKSIASKKEKYPTDFDLIVVQTKNFKIEEFNL